LTTTQHTAEAYITWKQKDIHCTTNVNAAIWICNLYTSSSTVLPGAAK